jgi:hypothetical protein
MPRFEIEAGGRRFEVEAPNMEAATAALGGTGGQQQQPEMGWGQYLQGLGREAVQGATMDFGDELGLTDRAASQQFGQQYPIASTVARIAGGLPLFALGPGAAAARWATAARTLPQAAGRSALL